MMSKSTYADLASRIEQLDAWLEDNAPYVQFDQQHLDGGSLAQAYFHLGYRMALRDVLARLIDDSDSTPDTASRSPSADLDE